MLSKATTLVVLLLVLNSAAGVWLSAAPSSQEGLPSVDRDLRVSPSSDPDPRNETSIAVSATDDRIVVGASKVIVAAGTFTSGSQRVAYYYSSDGGQTWGHGVVGLETPQKTWSRCTDPAVASDSNGNFYLSLLMLDDLSFDSGVYVLRSVDGGRTFSDPTPVAFDIGSGGNPKLVDKCYLTVDTSPSSPFRNTIYAAWVRIDRDGSGTNRAGVFVSHRRPGQTSFSEPKVISHFGDMRGPSLATGPNGEFYAAWEGIGSPRVLLFNASTDGGDTFLPPVVAPGTDYRIHSFVGSLSQPSPVVRIAGVDRMNSFPVIDVDRSTGPNRGMIYVAWAEARNFNDADVFVKKLGPPNPRPEEFPIVKANDDEVGADQFFPWLSVDSSSGSVEVGFYDRRNNPGELTVNTYIARSTDGGASFDGNTRISQQGSDPRIDANKKQALDAPIGLGDYIGMAAARGKGHLLWTDTREGKQNIYYGRITFEPSGDGGGPANDGCQTPRSITSARPFSDTLDTTFATSSPDDPVSCSGGRDTNSVWYTLTGADTVYGVDSAGSDYDTVVSVYTGTCGALTRIACSDNFGSAISPSNRSMLTFAARSGMVYLIEASGKGSGGTLRLRLGAPTVTGVEYTTGPDGNAALKISGASFGFLGGTPKVTVLLADEETILPSVSLVGERQGDGTFTMMLAKKKKLKKLIKKDRPVVIVVEDPAGGGITSVPFTFTRP